MRCSYFASFSYFNFIVVVLPHYLIVGPTKAFGKSGSQAEKRLRSTMLYIAAHSKPRCYLGFAFPPISNKATWNPTREEQKKLLENKKFNNSFFFTK